MARFALPKVHRPTALRILAARDVGTCKSIGRELRSGDAGAYQFNTLARAVGRLRAALPELDRSNPALADVVRRTLTKYEPLIAIQRLGMR